MTGNKQRDFRIGRLRVALLCGACICTASAAIAQQQGSSQAAAVPLKLRTDYFGYAASVSTRVGYSNNIDLARDGFERDDVILSTVFSGGAIISNNRVTGIVLGDLDFSYLINDGDFRINQSIGAASTFTAADNWLYLDLSGSTSRQLVGDNARFSSNINASRGDRANVHAFTASPYVYHQNSDGSAYELRYSFSQVFVDDSSTSVNVTGGDFLNDSRTHEGLAAYESGNAFEGFRFRAGVYGNSTLDDGSDIFPAFEYRQGTVFSEMQFALNDTFSLSGAVGYDEIDTEQAAAAFFDDDLLSGVYWRAGFIATPGQRSRIRLEYGRRFDDDFIDADISYELSSRFVFSAGASRTFQTRAQTNSAQFQGNQRQALDFADRLREGAELSPRGVIAAANRFSGGFNGGSAQNVGLGTVNSAFVNLTAAYDRTQVNLSGFYSDTDFGFRSIESLGLSLRADRRLSRRLTAYGELGYRRSDTAVPLSLCPFTATNAALFGFDTTDPLFDPTFSCLQLVAGNGVTNTVLGSIGASYRFLENVSGFVEVSHTERFSPNTLLEFDESTFLAGLTLDF